MLYHVILDVDDLFFVFVVSENNHKWLLRSPLQPLPTISKFWFIQENSTDDGSEQIEESFVEKIKVVIFTDSCLFYNLDICICEEYCLKLIWTFLVVNHHFKFIYTSHFCFFWANHIHYPTRQPFQKDWKQQRRCP